MTTKKRRATIGRDSINSSDAGYSLIEVLAAAALLAGVLVAILGMFIYGGQSVNAGKMLTKATSLSNDVLEEMRQLSFKQAYQLIEDGGNPANDTRYVWNSPTNTPNWPDDASSQAVLNAWRLQVAKGLPRGTMTVTVRGLADLGSNPPEATFANARVLQIVITVRWTEARRQRSVVFETIKV
jgi:type II secretory pathway pseudopilin PulG